MRENDRERPPTPERGFRPMEPNERIVGANRVDLCLQTFGDPATPRSSSSRDDHRDMGRSVNYEPGAPLYT